MLSPASWLSLRQKYIMNASIMTMLVITTTSVHCQEQSQAASVTLVFDGKEYQVPVGGWVLVPSNNNAACTVNAYNLQNQANTQQQRAQQLQSLNNSVKITFEDMLALKNKLQASGMGLCEFLQNYISEHKWRVTAGAVATGYLALQGRLWWLSVALRTGTWWSNWRDGISLSQLFEIPEQQLEDDLRVAIHERYTSAHSLEHARSPYTAFLLDVDQEMAMLNAYTWWCTTIATLRLQWLFFVNQDLVLKIPSRLDRLAYIRSRFMRFLSKPSR